MKMLRAFRTAVGFLTILPVGPRDAAAADFGRAVGFFPAAGVLFGLTAWAGLHGLGRLLPLPVAAWLTVFAGVWLNGAIHWDGFADTADGLGGSSPERRLAIMKDSRLGAFGGMALIFLALGKTLMLPQLLDQSPAMLVLVPVVSRWGMACFMATQPSVSQGLLRIFQLPNKTATLALATGLTLAAALWAGTGSLAVLGAALAALALLAPFIRRRFGGITGDILGATNELLELLGWAVLLVKFPG
ncbi:cobalamin-5'-phosphate synthase [Hydrogenispora ethanolica]|jgi:adenosylcobinamide-GDP ribazoletransferase|uniref:Adenosylcobinamide-GDP ribazoletransferase n=1 Tax=Hydrogenispora ethanolica TaxID=1082276 RepID=A0A4R1S4A0_HYDET|nr:adenosylcobinamide-GDP ribazoletransferase [Hydrogenispora ethanolica]TCL74088.1 cobalamin-5'-phosphate synthase [Hydrogenispora ethanolica]